MTISKHITAIMGYSLCQTCFACPEQYEVFLNGEQVGYLRLRHGHFTAETPDCGGELVYESEPRGDGSFEEDEREAELTNAIRAIHAHRTGYQCDSEEGGAG